MPPTTKTTTKLFFSNPDGISLQEIESIIKSQLIDGSWFVAKDLDLPDLHFKEYPWDSEIDHGWHEFESVEEAEDFSSEAIPITHFLRHILIDKSTDRD